MVWYGLERLLMSISMLINAKPICDLIMLRLPPTTAVNILYYTGEYITTQHPFRHPTCALIFTSERIYDVVYVCILHTP